MRLRVVNYCPLWGGGQRFFIQLLKALQQSGAFSRIEFVSHGEALAQLRAIFADYGIEAVLTDIPWQGRAGGPTFSAYLVPLGATDDCDIAWFPWMHYHRLTASVGPRVVASFHDGLVFANPIFTSHFGDVSANERETVRQWIRSGATMVCSSHYWTIELSRMFGCAPGRFEIVPVSGRHAPKVAHHAVDITGWPWIDKPFVLCPANISWHKNHEVLFEGHARARVPWPLVLTGWGSDLVNRTPRLRRVLRRIAQFAGLRPPQRTELLRDMARRLGMVPGRTLFPVGDLNDAEYGAVLERAACVVMPTLGEGGGSFPVEEAALRGIPVICSDIPVLREHMARLGAEVLWFDPHDPGSLADRLARLVREHEALRASARAQVARLQVRRWADVAADYLRVFRSALASARAE